MSLYIEDGPGVELARLSVEQQRIVRLLIEKVIVSPNDLEVRFRPNGIEVLALELQHEWDFHWNRLRSARRILLFSDIPDRLVPSSAVCVRCVV